MRPLNRELLGIQSWTRRVFGEIEKAEGTEETVGSDAKRVVRQGLAATPLGKSPHRLLHQDRGPKERIEDSRFVKIRLRSPLHQPRRRVAGPRNIQKNRKTLIQLS